MGKVGFLAPLSLCICCFPAALCRLTLDTNVMCFSALVLLMWNDHFAPFFRLFFTRTKIFKVVVMSAAMTAQTFTLTSVGVTPSEWKAAVSWYMSVPIIWATSIIWREASILNTRDGMASVALFDPVAWFQWWAQFNLLILWFHWYPHCNLILSGVY